MKLQDALKETGIAEAYYDGKTICVREDEDNETFEDTLVLSISDGMMPPNYQKEFKHLEEVEADLKTTYFPDNLDWKVVELEQ